MKDIPFKIIEDIRDLKIQGAENIALNGVKALFSFIQLESDLEQINFFIINLINARITEPTLRNAVKNLLYKTGFDQFLDFLYDNLGYDINFYKKYYKKIEFNKDRLILNYNKVMDHFHSVQDDINQNVLNFVEKYYKHKNILKIYTHCHSNTVALSIINLKNKLPNKKIVVYNTETRPLYQGRITALQLLDAGIDVHHFVDSGMLYCIKECDIVMLGCDAIELNGDVINKIGSGAISFLADNFNKPLAIITDSWKIDSKTKNKKEEIEIRNNFEIIDQEFKKQLEDRNIYIDIAPSKVIVGKYENDTTNKGRFYVKNYAFEKIRGDKVFVLITEIDFKMSRDI
ncbi:MAG: hypothetical protein PHT94_01570 [Candidatus Nanoarchaeia archaeon]|nr:hypothetical protein [Candidatus Nanoarchaeia archaeon]